MNPGQMPSEQQLREDYTMLETAKAQLDGLMRQQQLIQLAVDEHVRARETIKQLAGGAPGDEVLVPLGAESYVHSKISENRDVVIGIGSGVSIKKSPDEAEKVLDGKIDELSRAFKSVADKAAQTEALIQELSEKVQAQMEILQSAGGA